MPYSNRYAPTLDPDNAYQVVQPAHAPSAINTERFSRTIASDSTYPRPASNKISDSDTRWSRIQSSDQSAIRTRSK